MARPTTRPGSTRSRHPPRRAGDDAQAPPPRRRGRARTATRGGARLARPAPIGALGYRTGARPPPRPEEPGDESDLAVAVGPLLAGSWRGDVPAARRRLRQRVLEALVGRRARAAVAQPGRDRHRAQGRLTGVSGNPPY